MHVDYTKICRVCMSNGSRDIFVRSFDSGNPLEKLLEKLRYVTMIKIEENDDLPRLLCDLCIVQLNVAYNFKRQAIDNDTKLRQYFIENGISGAHPTSSQSNNTSTITNISKETSTIRTPASNVSPVLPQQKNTFPIIPIIIKEEPNEDAIVTSPINSIAPPNRSLPDKNSMVYLNSCSLNNLTHTNDVEMCHHNDKNNLASTSIDNTENQKPDSSNDTLIQNVTKKFYQNNGNINANPSDTRKQLAKKRLGQLKTSRIIPGTLEMKKLSINMVSPMGKLSRNEMKKNLDYTPLFKKKQSKTSANSATLNIKTSRVNEKNNTLNELLLNPFNNIEKKGRDKNKKKSRKQNEGHGATKLLKPKIEPDSKN